MNKIMEKFLRAEEAVIRVNEDEISLQELYDDIPIGVRVIIVSEKNKRKRVVDLGLLSFILKNCKDGEKFVKAYIDLSRSLNDIKEDFGVITELEYLSLCPEEKLKTLDKDLVSVLQKLKTHLSRRNKESHEL
ncbi:hypothetical protein [Stygiolobus caldivivus]|uniref:Uncharacterized protein n=1 Tax=Stygiolobus caldivivus TaxID=2824673 RepID=A0A8D5U8K2_9CREN|nr:hypothetical protein [Stygiolobus caldivivus]BCU71389.1 hypothetical protein KN1_26860 [Stygiolobus caldivivus]